MSYLPSPFEMPVEFLIPPGQWLRVDHEVFETLDRAIGSYQQMKGFEVERGDHRHPPAADRGSLEDR